MNYFRKVSIQMICFFLWYSCAFPQNTKPDSVSQIVNRMPKNNTYELSSTIGYFGAPSQQYQYFKRLLCLASDKQLIYFAQHYENAVVALFLSGLAKKKRKDPYLAENQVQKRPYNCDNIYWLPRR